MPKTSVLFYAELDGSSPVLDFLVNLRRKNAKAYAKCLVRIERLEALGHELRRPEADVLRNGIYELRVRLGSVNYRLLYFFAGKQIAVLGHAITKEDTISDRDIDLAIHRMRSFHADPKTHTFSQPLDSEHAEPQ
jgi:phage-related protein